jgi:hypothetical protein
MPGQSTNFGKWALAAVAVVRCIMINFACPRQESGFMAALRAFEQLDLLMLRHIRMNISK